MARIGIVGVGHLAAYIVEGLFRGDRAPEVLLSPRNREVSAALAARFPLRVAGNSQQVVDGCDVVILSVPPTLTVESARALRFRPDQVVVCVAAAVPLDPVATACRPAATVRAMPMTAVALGESPIPMFPGNAVAQAVCGELGEVQVLGSEAEFEAATCMAMHYGWVFGVIVQAAEWLKAQDVAPDKAYALAAQATRAASAIALDRGTALPDELASIARTGSFTGLGWRTLQQRGVPEAWSEACDAVLTATRARGDSSPPG